MALTLLSHKLELREDVSIYNPIEYSDNYDMTGGSSKHRIDMFYSTALVAEKSYS